MKTQITTILIVCGALLASATTASAMSPKPGQACILGICWDKPNKWKPNYGGRADADTGTLEAETEVAEIDTGTLEAETEVAMWTPTYELKAWYCMKGSMGKQMQHKDSTCIGGTPRPVYGRRGDAGEYTGANDVVVAGAYTGDANLEVAMMTQDMVDSWRSTLERHYDYSAVDLDENYATQLAFRGRGSTCSLNPYGRRSAYCNDSEVEAPVEQIIASTEFGNCLLDDKPIDIEQLVDCRSDACLGRKFYYGSFGKVGR